jgi:hypothetical protein
MAIAGWRQFRRLAKVEYETLADTTDDKHDF